MYNYEKFQRDCHLIFSGSHPWHSFVQFKHFKILLVTFKILHGAAPSYLKDLVSVLPDSRYQLRRNNKGILLERPRLRTKKTLGDRALSMAAPFLWNSLPLPIRQETSIDFFKRSVKTYLFKKAFSQIIYLFIYLFNFKYCNFTG